MANVKARTLNVGDKIVHPRRHGDPRAIMNVEEVAGMTVLVRNINDGNDFLFLNGDTRVERVTV